MGALRRLCTAICTAAQQYELCADGRRGKSGRCVGVKRGGCDVRPSQLRACSGCAGVDGSVRWDGAGLMQGSCVEQSRMHAAEGIVAVVLEMCSSKKLGHAEDVWMH